MVNLFARLPFLISLLVLCFVVAGCSLGPASGSHQASSSYNLSREKSTKEWRPTQRHSIPVVINEPVKKWIKAFNGPLRPSFTRWMKRIGHYGPTIEDILKKEKVPVDLIYLAMIESGFNMRAMSSASAAGPWQFISSTGRMYGLNQSFFVDDRSDIVQATHAAASHLRDLYKIYNDWYLAFAAYNAGGGKVNRAIKRMHSRNYWTLASRRSRHLMPETKNYVPKILAALHIVKNYRKYGYTNDSFGVPLAFEKVTVPDATDVNAIAQSAETTIDHIKKLNPRLKIGITPPNKRFEVYIPHGASDEFKRNYARIPSSKRVSNLYYSAGHKETIASIAKKYQVSANYLAKINRKSTRQTLKTGTKITIPASKTTLLAMAKYTPTSNSGTRVTYYRVKRGDTLSRIAHKTSSSTSKIAKWNNIRKNSKLSVGQKLKIYNKSRYHSSNTGKLYAASYAGDSNKTTPNKQRRRLSGVMHIIQQDKQTEDPRKKYSSRKKHKTHNEIYNEPQVETSLPEVAANTETFEENLSSTSHPGTVKTMVVGQPQIIPLSNKYHIVKSGESLSSISAKYKLRLSQLKSLNNLKSNRIRIKQKLLVSRGTDTVSNAPKQIVATHTKASTYIVKSRDTLGAIANKHRLSLKQLKTLNNLSSNKIKIGQKLKVTGSATTQTQIAQAKSTQSKVIFHHVKKGETLWSLSRKYRVKISEIKKWNQLKTDQVKPKQKIKIIA